ncbi:hypothetical protein DSO57_1024036, partial [Entomophthora muscae]
MLMSIGKIAAAMGFEKSTMATTLQAHANCGPSLKKIPTGACTSTKDEKAHLLMMAIMKCDPQMPLVQICLQLGLHSIFTNKRTFNKRMYRVVVAARILSNKVLSGPSLVDINPYNATIINFIKERAMNVTVGSIMPGIICTSKKAQKAGKPLLKLTKLKDLNQTVDWKCDTAAPVCQLKPVSPCKLTLINWRNLRVTQYKLVN